MEEKAYQPSSHPKVQGESTVINASLFPTQVLARSGSTNSANAVSARLWFDPKEALRQVAGSV